MHPDSMGLMEQFARVHRERVEGKKVLDVGSQDINGNYRGIFAGLGCEYTGTDIVGGANVDVISPWERLSFEDEIFDVVICGQTLEHAEKPWELVKEIARVLKPGGIVCLIAPWRFHVHKDELCPYDRWRILEDGMATLIKHAGLELISLETLHDDTCGIGQKPA